MPLPIRTSSVSRLRDRGSAVDSAHAPHIHAPRDESGLRHHGHGANHFVAPGHMGPSLSTEHPSREQRTAAPTVSGQRPAHPNGPSHPIVTQAPPSRSPGDHASAFRTTALCAWLRAQVHHGMLGVTGGTSLIIPRVYTTRSCIDVGKA